MMRRGEVEAILTSRDWLAEVEPSLASAVVAAGRVITLRRGEALYQPGDDARGMYGVIDGGILISVPGRNGLPVPGHVLRRYAWFGYSSMLDVRTRIMIPAANEPSAVLHVPVGELHRLRGAFPGAGLAFGRLAVWGEAIYLAVVTDLLIADAPRRLAAVLLRVTGAESPDRPGDLPADPVCDPWAGPDGVPLTQALLAELARASPHTVARFVDRAVQAGWIAWTYGRVRILDAGRLAAFAAGGSGRPVHAPSRSGA